MSGVLKGAFGYIYSSKTPPETPKEEDSLSSTSLDTSATEARTPEDDSKEKGLKHGYLMRAVTGISSGVYSVGTTTVGAGINGVKWIAGTTYSVGSGVVGTVGSVAGGTANAVAGAVSSGASAVISRVSSSKEHED